jgi:D-alanine transaminase
MRDHVMPTDITPTVFAMVNRLYIYAGAERAKGVACVTADDFRWKKAHIKSTSLAGRRAVAADERRRRRHRDHHVPRRLAQRGLASNVWIVKDGVVLGPPKDNLVLEGIRYGLLEQLCRRGGIPFELRRVSRAEVFGADEV